MKYQTPKMELVNLEVVDIITGSFGDGEYGDGSSEPVVKPPQGSWGE